MTTGEIETLIAAVAQRLDEVTERVVACFRREILAYAALPEPDLRPGVRSNIERALEALARGWEPTADEVVAARALGEHRAQQGMPLDALLQAHRIGVREALAMVRAQAREQGVGAEAVLDLATRVWAWADAVMLAAAGGHRDRELDLAGQEQQQRAYLLRGLLHGGLDEAGLRAGAAAYGIGLHDAHTPVAVAGQAADVRRLERSLNEAGAAHGATVLLGHLEGALAGIVGPGADGRGALDICEQAAAGAAAGLVIAVGLPATLTELVPAYALTRRMLEAAQALGNSGIVSVGDVALHAAVLAQNDIGEVLDERYLGPLDAEGDFGIQLLATLDAWYEHGMRPEETAVALFVHPNTLRHRLRRAETLTGLSLQRTEDRFVLWWALTRRRLRESG